MEKNIKAYTRKGSRLKFEEKVMKLIEIDSMTYTTDDLFKKLKEEGIHNLNYENEES